MHSARYSALAAVYADKLSVGCNSCKKYNMMAGTSSLQGCPNRFDSTTAGQASCQILLIVALLSYTLCGARHDGVMARQRHA